MDTKDINIFEDIYEIVFNWGDNTNDNTMNTIFNTTKEEEELLDSIAHGRIL